MSGLLARVTAALQAPRDGDAPPPADGELMVRAQQTLDRLLVEAPADVRALPLYGLLTMAGPAVVVAAWKRMMPRGLTMCGPDTVAHLVGLLDTLQREQVPGDWLEAGVWRGGLPLLMRAYLAEVGDAERSVWLADSFDGLPPDPSRAEDRLAHALLLGIGSLRVTRPDVEALFTAYGLLDARVRFIEGVFATSLPGAPVGALSLLRIDADYFEGTRDALEAMYARVSAGAS